MFYVILIIWKQLLRRCCVLSKSWITILTNIQLFANGPKLTSKVGTANNRTGPLVDTNIYGLHSDQIGCQISFFLRRQTLV
jgi:hypothetical protein